jgi:hypothetical protein
VSTAVAAAVSVQSIPAANDPISNFCAHAVATFAPKWPPDEATLASEFVRFLGLQDCTFWPQLSALCSRLSVELYLIDLPPENSGINVRHGKRRAIFVNKAELPGLSREQTVLHELREILEYEFRELGRPLAKKNDLEERSEMFALFVRMECAVAMWSAILESVRQPPSTMAAHGGVYPSRSCRARSLHFHADAVF